MRQESSAVDSTGARLGREVVDSYAGYSRGDLIREILRGEANVVNAHSQISMWTARTHTAQDAVRRAEERLESDAQTLLAWLSEKHEGTYEDAQRDVRVLFGFQDGTGEGHDDDR